MRYRLETLLGLLAIAPPLLAAVWIVRDDIAYTISGLVQLAGSLVDVDWTELFMPLIGASMLGVCTAIVMWLLGFRHTTLRR